MSAGWIVAGFAAITLTAIACEIADRRTSRRRNGQDSP